MGEHLYSGLLNQEGLCNLMDRLDIFKEEGTLLLLQMIPWRWMEEREREEAYLFKPYNGSLELAKYQQGRVFNQRGELYFARRDEGYRVIYGGPTLADLDQLAPYPLELEIHGPKRYYLWGKKIEDEQREKMGLDEGDFPLYLELMIPRIFGYPVDDKSRRCQLFIMEYLDKGNGHTQHFRFHHLEGVEG